MEEAHAMNFGLTNNKLLPPALHIASCNKEKQEEIWQHDTIDCVGYFSCWNCESLI